MDDANPLQHEEIIEELTEKSKNIGQLELEALDVPPWVLCSHEAAST